MSLLKDVCLPSITDDAFAKMQGHITHPCLLLRCYRRCLGRSALPLEALQAAVANLPTVDPCHCCVRPVGLDPTHEQLCPHCGFCGGLPHVHSGCAQHKGMYWSN